MSGIDSFDWAILRWLNAYALQMPVLDPVMERMLDARSLSFALILMVLWYLWFQKASSFEVRSRIVMTVLGALIALCIGRLLAEGLPFRIRPFAVAGNDLRVLSDVTEPLRTWSSFPSDHTVMAFALSMGLWMMIRSAGALAFLLAVFAISFPRLFLGMHYPSDLLGAALIGIVIGRAVHAETIRSPVSAFILSLEARYCGAFYAVSFMLTYEITRMFNDLRRPVAIVFSLLHQG